MVVFFGTIRYIHHCESRIQSSASAMTVSDRDKHIVLIEAGMAITN